MSSYLPCSMQFQHQAKKYMMVSFCRPTRMSPLLSQTKNGKEKVKQNPFLRVKESTLGNFILYSKNKINCQKTFTYKTFDAFQIVNESRRSEKCLSVLQKA